MTKREKIELQREAFARGAVGRMGGAELCPQLRQCSVCDAARAKAAEAYPMPQQPRVVKGPLGLEYRVVDGVIEVRSGDIWAQSIWLADEVPTLADLVANPLENAE